MANKSTFIKIDRNILRWMWYNNGNVFRVFVHLLLIAGAETRDVGTYLLARGDALTSLESMQQSLNMSKQEVRTALATLKKTGEITQYQTGRKVVYHITNYDYYQGRATRTQHETNTNLTQLSTQFSGAEKSGANRVSTTSGGGELTRFATRTQHELNTNLTPVKKEELRTKNNISLTPRACAREENPETAFLSGEDETRKNIYGRYGNVRLTDSEYKDLFTALGEDVLAGAIDLLDGHIQKRGAAFRSECHAAEIREWCASKYKRISAESASAEKKASRTQKAQAESADRLAFDLDEIFEKP